MSTDPYREPRHPIRVVMERTGLPLETLRAWERRHGVVRPQRTEGAQRRYSDADVERLRLLHRVVAAGRSIGQVAALSTDELATLAREDADQAGARDTSRAEADAWAILLASAKGAVEALDAGRLEAVLGRAALLAGARSFVDAIAVPLLRWLGTGWAEGTLSVAHEHLASAVLRRSLGGMLSDAATPPDAPVVVCATPARQVHEFGILLAAVAVSALGWRAVYLGADVPAEDIAVAVRSTKAETVALSVVYPSADPGLVAELRKLRAELGPGVRIILGGSGLDALTSIPAELRVELVRGLGELEAALTGPVGSDRRSN